MARVVVFVPDLLFGSNVTSAVQTAGHEPVLVADAEGARRELPSAELLIIDLTADAPARIEALRPVEIRTLAFYSHVEADVRRAAEEAGFELVVPRSRMAREGAALVTRLLGS